MVIPAKPMPPIRGHTNVKMPRPNVDGEDMGTAVRLRDQKAEADDALVKLQDLLGDVFEAEDEIDQEVPVATATERPNPVFVNARSLDVHGAVLSSDAHNRLQKAIRKVTGYDRLQDIPSEDLKRVQRLCEKPIVASQVSDLRLNDSSSENEAQEWVGKVEDVLNALLATGTFLLTMSGQQTERDLCPENLIKAIPGILIQAFDHCIIPAVESRSSGKDSDYFAFYSAQRRIVGSLIQQSKKVLALFADFLSRIEVPEEIINPSLFFAANSIFVENAHNDKDSAVGYQKYEAARRGAMDLLAKIFARYPKQRQDIVDQILGSLEKLPSTRQNARQFKLADGKNIQLLTALILQLVQTTALETPRSSKAKRRLQVPHDDDDDKLIVDDERKAISDDDEELDESLERLATKVKRLHDEAAHSAQYIVGFMVQRASTATKGGETPYRNILDIFTEDLINVLGSMDWPAAELLLRTLASHMVGVATSDKHQASAKSMALEHLGWMGSAISDLISTAQHMLPALEDSGSDLTDGLKQHFDDFLSRALHPQDLVAPRGPYNVAFEYLSRDSSGNSQLTSARGYYLAHWAMTVCPLYYSFEDKVESAHDDMIDELVVLLSKSFSDPRWLETHK